MNCPYCHKSVLQSHLCPAHDEREVTHDDSGNFLLSAVIGYETDNAILGGLAGGDMLGGIIGAELADSNAFSSPDPTPDTSSAFYGGGGDTGGGGATDGW